MVKANREESLVYADAAQAQTRAIAAASNTTQIAAPQRKLQYHSIQAQHLSLTISEKTTCLRLTKLKRKGLEPYHHTHRQTHVLAGALIPNRLLADSI